VRNPKLLASLACALLLVMTEPAAWVVRIAGAYLAALVGLIAAATYLSRKDSDAHRRAPVGWVLCANVSTATFAGSAIVVLASIVANGARAPVATATVVILSCALTLEVLADRRIRKTATPAGPASS
jgi:RsiW-degrading membrane proteinase PrsW (M82 family)